MDSSHARDDIQIRVVVENRRSGWSVRRARTGFDDRCDAAEEVVFTSFVKVHVV